MDMLKRVLISAGLFGFLGPPIGALVLVVMMVVGIANEGPVSSGDLGAFLGLGVIAIVFSYPAALAPALLTGAICAVFERSISSNWRWIATCAVAGAVVTGAYTVLVALSGFGNASVSIIALGAFAAAVCGWTRRTARWPIDKRPAALASAS